MNINLTMLFQGIHFFIAYLIIRFLFVKPSMEALASDNIELQQLSELLAEQNRLIELKEAERLKLKMRCQEGIKAQMPSLHGADRYSHFPSLDSFPENPPELVTQLVRDMQQEIAKRLSHVEL